MLIPTRRVRLGGRRERGRRARDQRVPPVRRQRAMSTRSSRGHGRPARRSSPSPNRSRGATRGPSPTRTATSGWSANRSSRAVRPSGCARRPAARGSHAALGEERRRPVDQLEPERVPVRRADPVDDEQRAGQRPALGPQQLRAQARLEDAPARIARRRRGQAHDPRGLEHDVRPAGLDQAEIALERLAPDALELVAAVAGQQRDRGGGLGQPPRIGDLGLQQHAVDAGEGHMAVVDGDRDDHDAVERRLDRTAGDRDHAFRRGRDDAVGRRRHAGRQLIGAQLRAQGRLVPSFASRLPHSLAHRPPITDPYPAAAEMTPGRGVG